MYGNGDLLHVAFFSLLTAEGYFSYARFAI